MFREKNVNLLHTNTLQTGINSIYVRMKVLKAIVAVVIIATSCQQIPENLNDSPSNEFVVESNFNYSLLSNSSSSIALYLPNGLPASDVKVKFSYDLEGEQRVIFSGFTNSEGHLSVQLSYPQWVKEIIVDPIYIGIPNKTISIDELEGSIIEIGRETYTPSTTSRPLKNGIIGRFHSFGGWDGNGLVDYLDNASAEITSKLLQKANASLPEGKKVVDVHPEYLDANNETNLVIYEDAEVWVTFLHEGSSWKNSFGFYTYHLGEEPETVDEISNRTIIFPNASYISHGGCLRSGNTVKLQYLNPETNEFQSTFPANTVIGWIFVGNSWKGELTEGDFEHYSNKKLNNRNNLSLMQQNLFLYDQQDGYFLLSFEDKKRDDAKCDHDFNDVVFCVKINPIEECETNNTPPVDEPADSDGDGINDDADSDPNDPAISITSSYPAENVFGSLVFEDKWPSVGDYDFNDLVLDYNYIQLMNTNNEVVGLNAKFVIKAVGAEYANALAIQLPISSARVNSVKGQILNGSIFSMNQNGTESGNSTAVIPVFDFVGDVITSQYEFFNTRADFPFEKLDTISIQILFNSPVPISALGLPPFNPFVVIDEIRGKEVHLPDYIPTERVDDQYFGTANDASNYSTDKFYNTSQYLPWAINIPESFDYPYEKQSVLKAYLKMREWAESNGTQYPDWYLNNSGYRDESFIYSK